MKNILLVLSIMITLPALAMEDSSRQEGLKQAFLEACGNFDEGKAQNVINEWTGLGFFIGNLVNAKGQNGQRPLHLVLNPFLAKVRNRYDNDDQNKIKLLALLAKYGADPGLKNDDEYDVLYLAVLANHQALDLRVFKAFLGLFNGALMDLVVANMNTELDPPLPHLVFSGSREFVSLFLSHFGHSMDLTLKNSNGKTPIQLLKEIFDEDHVLLVTKTLCQLNLVDNLNKEDKELLGQGLSFLGCQDSGSSFISQIDQKAKIRNLTLGELNLPNTSLLQAIEKGEPLSPAALNAIKNCIKNDKGCWLSRLLYSAIRNNHLPAFDVLWTAPNFPHDPDSHYLILSSLLACPASGTVLAYVIPKLIEKKFFENGGINKNMAEICDIIMKTDNFQGFEKIYPWLDDEVVMKAIMKIPLQRSGIASKYVHYMLDGLERGYLTMNNSLIAVSVQHNIVDALLGLERMLECEQWFYRVVISKCLEFNNKDAFDIFVEKFGTLKASWQSNMLGYALSLEGREHMLDALIAHCSRSEVFFSIFSKLNKKMVSHAFDKLGLPFLKHIVPEGDRYLPFWHYLLKTHRELLLDLLRDKKIDSSELVFMGISLEDLLLSWQDEGRLPNEKIDRITQQKTVIGLDYFPFHLILETQEFKDDLEIFFLMGGLKELKFSSWRKKINFGRVDIAKEISIDRFNGESVKVSLLDRGLALYKKSKIKHPHLLLEMGLKNIEKEVFYRYLEEFKENARLLDDKAVERELDRLKAQYEVQEKSELLEDIFKKNGLTFEKLVEMIENGSIASTSKEEGSTDKEEVNPKKRPPSDDGDDRPAKKSNEKSW